MVKVQKGFTILEMAMVLVVVSLVLGGIFVGSDIVRNATVNTIITDMKRYEAAVHSFRNKYVYLPGDFPDASQYWGDSVGNGNGSGQIELGNENLLAWQHMALAGYVERSYAGEIVSYFDKYDTKDAAILTASNGIKAVGTVLESILGIPSAQAICPLAGVEVPKAGGVQDGAYYVEYFAEDDFFDGSQPGHYIRVGSQNGVDYVNTFSFVTPLEAEKIDMKLDDGVALEGRVYGVDAENAISQCVLANGEYNLINDNRDCYLGYRIVGEVSVNGA